MLLVLSAVVYKAEGAHIKALGTCTPKGQPRCESRRLLPSFAQGNKFTGVSDLVSAPPPPKGSETYPTTYTCAQTSASHLLGRCKALSPQTPQYLPQVQPLQHSMTQQQGRQDRTCTGQRAARHAWLCYCVSMQTRSPCPCCYGLSASSCPQLPACHGAAWCTGLLI